MGPGSRLQRGTPFLCDVRFTASLPEVACDPKLVVEPPADVRALARFSLTSLERGPIRDVALGEDAAGAAAVVVSGTGERSAVGSLAGGLCVSLLTPESFEFSRAQGSILSAEDATLLVNAERALATARSAEAKAASASASTAGAAAATTTRAAPAAAATIARKPQGKELAWLMRTSYVTAAGGTRGGTGRGAGGGILAGAEEQQQGGEERAPPLDRDEVLREIDATFAAAASLDAGTPPRHPTRPGELAAVAVRPVLPHAGMAGNHHVLLTLDKDPLQDCVPAAAFAKKAKKSGEGAADAKPRLTSQEEDYLLSRAVTKSYKAARDPERPEAEPEKFLGYMVPSEIPEGLLLLLGGGEGDGERDGNGNDAGNPSTSSASAVAAAAAASHLRSLPFSGEYEWVREFMFRIEKGEAGAAKKRSYLLDLSSSSSLPSSSSSSKKQRKTANGLDAEPVRIVDLDTRLAAFSQRLSTPVNRPSSIKIGARERTGAEEEAARARREAVVGRGSSG